MLGSMAPKRVFSSGGSFGYGCNVDIEASTLWALYANPFGLEVGQIASKMDYRMSVEENDVIGRVNEYQDKIHP
jgi:hypothetical protein